MEKERALKLGSAEIRIKRNLYALNGFGKDGFMEM